MRVAHEQIPYGAPGLAVKVARLRQLVRSARADPAFRGRVAALVRRVPEKDADGEIGAVSAFVRRRVRYLRDPVAVEFFQAPQILLGQALAGHAQGDCDDLTALGAAMLESIGYPTRFRVGALAPDVYGHVWLDVLHPRKGWLAVDDTAKGKRVGWDPSDRFPFTETYDTMGSLGFPEYVTLAAPPRRRMRRGLPPGCAMVCGPARFAAANRRQQRRTHLDALGRVGSYRAGPTASGSAMPAVRWPQGARLAVPDRLWRSTGFERNVPDTITDARQFDLYGMHGLGGLGKFKFKKLFKKFGKILPLAAPLIPGVGPVVGGILGAAGGIFGGGKAPPIGAPIALPPPLSAPAPEPAPAAPVIAPAAPAPIIITAPSPAAPLMPSAREERPPLFGGGAALPLMLGAGALVLVMLMGRRK